MKAILTQARLIAVYTCISYSSAVLLIAFFVSLLSDYTSLPIRSLGTLFVIMLLICTTIQLIEQLPTDRRILLVVLHNLAIYFWVFFIWGYLLKAFPFTYPFVPYAFLIISVTYAVVYVLAYVRNLSSVENINKALDERKTKA